MDPADLCKTCGKEVLGGDAFAFVLPSPVSSYHEQHHLECLTRSAFHIELSLARMAVGLAGRNKGDLACESVVHQVRRLVTHYQNAGEHERAQKLRNIVDWWDAGAVPSTDIAVLSET